MSASLRRWALGLLLINLGGFMAALVASGQAWQFLNPKYQWLTGLTAGGLLLTGVVVPFDQRLRPRLTTLAALVVFAVIGGYAASGMVPVAAPPGMATSAPQDTGPSRVTVQGQEYVRMNTAEAYLLAEKAQSAAQPPLRIAVRGMVAHTPELTARGEMGLVRLSITCCFADALGVGLRVRGVEPGSTAPGSWLLVHGRLETLPDPDERVGAIVLPGVITTMLSSRMRLVAEAVEGIEPPAVPYMFEYRDKEPYAF